MELVVLLIAVIGVLGWFLWKDRKYEDSGNHPLDGATKNSALDVNQDGRVDLKDAVAAAEIVVEETKKVAKKAKVKAKTVTEKAKAVAKKTTAKKKSK